MGENETLYERALGFWHVSELKVSLYDNLRVELCWVFFPRTQLLSYLSFLCCAFDSGKRRVAIEL